MLAEMKFTPKPVHETHPDYTGLSLHLQFGAAHYRTVIRKPAEQSILNVAYLSAILVWVSLVSTPLASIIFG